LHQWVIIVHNLSKSLDVHSRRSVTALQYSFQAATTTEAFSPSSPEAVIKTKNVCDGVEFVAANEWNALEPRALYHDGVTRSGDQDQKPFRGLHSHDPFCDGVEFSELRDAESFKG
jgi:hypothetical protein